MIAQALPAHHASEQASLRIQFQERQNQDRRLLADATVSNPKGKSHRFECHPDITVRKAAEGRRCQGRARLLLEQDIPERLLPQSSPETPGLDIAGAVYPAEFAVGDYVDYLHLPDESLGVVIGGASGRGVCPAALAASSSATIRACAETCDGIDEIMVRTNVALSRESHGDLFVSLLFVQLDWQARILTYVNAGHPPGYVLDRDGDVRAVLRETGLPLAVSIDSEYPIEGPLRFEAHDTILLITDGILAAASRDGQMFGTQRLLDVVRDNRTHSASQIVTSLRHAVSDFTGQDRLLDDFTTVVIAVGP